LPHIRIGHEDLPTASNGVTGWDNQGIGGVWNVDKDGHGTHCAGTIGKFLSRSFNSRTNIAD